MSADNTIFAGQPDADTFGGRLSRAREAAGLSLPGLARAIGVREETLAAWEQDRSEPRANRVVMLAGLVNVSPAWLMSGMGEAPEQQELSRGARHLIGEIERVKQLREQTDAVISSFQGLLEQMDRESRRQREPGR
ncbi:MAG TPA: helix-turn-helix transcriptional regulator [Rhizobiaceae bacterium]|nr:helix-turn-helix transcriptional regulator [Rhizobiaceae bacterium]